MVISSHSSLLRCRASKSTTERQLPSSSFTVDRTQPLSQMDRCTLADGSVIVQPQDNDSLIKLVLQRDIACTCREHSPELYQCEECHEDIGPAHRDLDRPFHRHRTRQQTSEMPILVKKGVYEANYLAHTVAASISMSENDMLRDQKLALEERREITYQGLGAIDASWEMSESQMLEMFNIYNRLFFLNALDTTFAWEHLSSVNRLAQCWSDHAGSHIEMDPQLLNWTTSKGYEGRKVQRLGTLLHEAIHALLQQYACRSCPAYDINVCNAGGHGRAFMIVATALEGACERLLGHKIDIGVCWSWRANWRYMRHLPSIHDLRMGKLVEEDIIEQWHMYLLKLKAIVMGIVIGIVVVRIWDGMIASLPKLW